MSMSTSSELFARRPVPSRTMPPPLPQPPGHREAEGPSPRIVLPVRFEFSSPDPTRVVDPLPAAPSLLLSAKRRSRFSSGGSMDWSSPRGSVRSVTTVARGSPGVDSTMSSSFRRTAILDEVEALRKTTLALQENDDMVYLEGPFIYSCGQCRTHLTSHDQIISKSFHGRHGRAYLLDECVNVVVGRAEDRRLLTGLHSVCDISCKRCDTLVGWTYKRAYEPSQKYKEGKFIVEKIHLHLEEDRCSRRQSHKRTCEARSWRKRSLSWSSTSDMDDSSSSLCSRESKVVREY